MARNAANSRRWREKKKKDLGLEWAKREAQRMKKYYVPTAQLTETEAQKRRNYIRESTRKSRSKKNRPLISVAEPEGSNECIFPVKTVQSQVSGTTMFPSVMVEHAGEADLMEKL